MTDRFLLDTCAVIWMANGVPLSREANIVLSRSSVSNTSLYISAMSSWEIGMLVSKGRLPTTKSAITWFHEAVEMIDAKVVDVVVSVLIASSSLPTPIHNDPTDRIIIATAREHDLIIITRDRAILAYGAAGHVKTLAC